MEIRKPFGLIVVLTIAVQSLFAQQQYQLSDYGGPGTLYLYNRLPVAPTDPAFVEPGENLTWDLSEFTGFNSHLTSIATPSQVIDLFAFQAFCSLSGHNLFECSAIWGSTEQALLSQDTLALLGLELANIQHFQNKTSNYLLENFLGFNIDFNGVPTQAVVVYDSPDTILQFPLTYGDSWESNIDWMIDLTSVGQNFGFISNQQRVSSVDAWGTIYTPFDTFTNVIRVRSEIRHMDTITMDSNSLPIDVIQLEYTWFDTAYKLPVMIATGILVDTLEVISVVEYLFERTCPQPTWSVEIDTNVFALDDNYEVTIEFNIVNGNADSYEWNFDDDIIDITTGSVNHTYYGPREYVVSVTGCMENCLPLNSCTTELIEFTIEDLTGINIVDGNGLGIRLFPNPASDQLELEIPEHLGNHDFRLADMTGRIIQTGQLTAGSAKLDIKSLAPGFYNIHVWNHDNGRHAILRFMKK